jgi:hypothetical protein
VTITQQRPESESPWSVASISDVEAGPEIPPITDIADRQRLLIAAPPPRGALTARTKNAPGSAAEFVWLGAHGGSGVSSLAIVSGQGVALTGQWPDPALGWPHLVAVVCRSNGSGFTSAARLIQEWASASVPGIELVALVVVADAPTKLTRGLKARLHELSGTVPQVLTVPWIAAWRDGPASVHPAVTEVASCLAALITKEKS